MFRGEIWRVNLEPTVGAEIRKSRPVIVVGDDRIGRLPLRDIVPLTDWKDRYAAAEWLVKIEPDAANNLDKISAADAFQVRSVSIKRFENKFGELSADKMRKIVKALGVVFKIET